MSILRKIGSSYGLLLLIALACAGLSIWNAATARLQLERVDLAHKSYEAHLRLHNHALRLFHEFELGLASGTPRAATFVDTLKNSIKSEIALIRSTISAEIRLVGEEEIEELTALASLERLLEEAIADYERALADTRERGLPSDTGARSRPLDASSEIAAGNKFQPALDEEIKTALTEETEEIDETRTESLSMLGRARTLSVLLAMLAAISAGISFFLIARQIAAPLREIILGAQRYAEGNYSHRIEFAGGAEIGQIADAVNKAARQATERQKELQSLNDRLEDEVKRQTEELRRTILTLEEQKKGRQRLLADVSHELRTPLTVIQGEADIALRGGEKDVTVYKEALKRASEAARHTSQLVNDVLFIGRQESGQSKLDLQREDLVALVVSTLETMTSLLDRYGVAVKISHDTPTAEVPMDPNRMRQVVMILLENACFYGGKQIQVDIHRSQHGVVLSVKDDGPGISLADQAQLFERFFRGSNAAERYDSGAGLGLPVAKSIVEAHSGQIEVLSNPGDGTEFKVTLPAKNTIKAVS